MPIHLFGPPIPTRNPCWFALPDPSKLPVPALLLSLVPCPDEVLVPVPKISRALSALAPSSIVVGLDFDSWNVFSHHHGIVPELCKQESWELADMFEVPVIQSESQTSSREWKDEDEDDWVIIEHTELISLNMDWLPLVNALEDMDWTLEDGELERSMP